MTICNNLLGSIAFLKKLTHPKIWPFESIVEFAQKLYQKNPEIKKIAKPSLPIFDITEINTKEILNIVSKHFIILIKHKTNLEFIITKCIICFL